jgi:hypothetical protein
MVVALLVVVNIHLLGEVVMIELFGVSMMAVMI